MEFQQIQVILPDEMDQSLRKYFYQVAKEAVDQVRMETSLSKEIFRLGEACEYLSCSRSTLKKFINQRGLKVSVIGDCQFIRKEELARFIKEYEV
ncbi:helix-turn-helix domain-containing protein [Enterococcus faecium]|nr:helix-turn-helix domain-containing protein [Enterococcus faecium]MDQ8298365.1 helix-turn-helix domain-containing protein [Enterococcus faecium]MDQ8352781.1 helix-turn-helix domain-containing protein [Enterococcus faecium]MDQ8431013.1 helix-turn-helix domain-containing protein [Enterococcus faecium]